MFEGYYGEQVIRDRERQRARVQSLWGIRSRGMPGEDRAVLSADCSAWSWHRVGSVLGTIAVAVATSLALPASLQGLAWSLGQILALMSR